MTGQPDFLTRAAAKAAGERHYNTGRPCARGHTGPRQVANSCCVECLSATNKALYGRKVEEIKEYQRQYRASHIEKIRARDRLYHAANLVKNRERAILWARTNPERVKARGRLYREMRSEAARVWKLNWRAGERNARGRISESDIQRLRVAQRYKCALCRRSVRKAYHADHIMPLYLGGSNLPRNFQILCPTCNKRKAAKHPVIFSREIGLLI